MNTGPSTKNTLWEEKNSIEPKKNCLNNNAIEPNVIINNINNVSMKNQCNDIGKISGIYKIVNKVNGKYYVGSSNDVLKSRFYEHKRLLTKHKHFNIKLQNAWNKYGEVNFEFILVEKCNYTRTSLLECEQKYLDIANKEKSQCYNMTFVAGRVEWTPKLKNKISKLHKGNNYRKNSVMIHLTDDVISNLKKIWILSGKNKMIEEAKKNKIGGRVAWSLIQSFKKDQDAVLLRKKNYIYAIKKYMKLRTKESIPNYNYTVYDVHHTLSGDSFHGTKNEFYKKYGFYLSTELFSKKRKQYRGWILI
jgi:group I intron endonuclease